MAALGVRRPTDVPHATEYVESMVRMVGDLLSRDAAYVTDDGVYLDVTAVPDYGLLAHQRLDDMQAADREVFGAANKRNSADFALWKLSKPGEPSWPSPWGDGRPGWHSECVVMSLELLGDGFDLHCGGADLRFPHHENERAQAVALGRTFARHWMHNGFVVDAEGEKMSKSIGNVANLLDLIDRYDPRTYRMLLLQVHYRSPVRVGTDNIEAAQKSLAGIDAMVQRTAPLDEAAADTEVLDRFRSSMDDDLDTPTAMSVLFDAVRRANAALDAGDAATAATLRAAVLSMCAATGIEPRTGGGDDAATALAAELDAARAARDFARADEIRAELQAAGWLVETGRDGTTVRRA
jgi:cysteinyl-tRNA synthetase